MMTTSRHPFILLLAFLVMKVTNSSVPDLRKVELPSDTLERWTEDDMEFRLGRDGTIRHHHDIGRALRLRSSDATGYLVRFHSCGMDDNDNALVEVCLQSRKDKYGMKCDEFRVDYSSWVAFVWNYLITPMITDFCGVCQESCRGSVLDEGRMFSHDICNIRVWDTEDRFCDDFCDDAGKPVPAIHGVYCMEIPELKDSKCSDYPFVGRRRLCDVFEWAVDWIESCDSPGYPDYEDEQLILHGKAVIQCDYDETNANADLCKEFYNRLEPCNTPEDPLCQPWQPPTRAPTTIQDPSTFQKPNAVVVVKEDITGASQTNVVPEASPLPPAEIETRTPEQNTDGPYSAISLFLVLGVGVIGGGLLGLVLQNMRSRRTYSRAFPSNDDETRYQQVVEMDSFSLQ